MQTVNHHTHTTFSDGRSALAAVLAKAAEEGLTGIGITDHSPIPLRGVGHFDPAALPRYATAVRDAARRYAGRLEVYLGMEVDYIPGVVHVDVPRIAALAADYHIGAVHYVDAFADGLPFGFEASEEHFVRGVEEIFGGRYERAFTRYFELIREMVAEHPPEVVAHLDRMRKHNRGGVYFDEGSDWYLEQVELTIEAIAAAGVVMEVNTKSIYSGDSEEPYPGRWALTRARELGIRVHLASDAHEARHVTGGFGAGAALLREVGYEEVTVLRGGAWVGVPLGLSPKPGMAAVPAAPGPSLCDPLRGA